MLKHYLPLESTKCRIRDFDVNDIQMLADIEFDPEVKQYVGGVPNGTKKEWIVKAKSYIHGYAIESILENELAGRVSLHRAEKWEPGTAELQVIIGKKFWGRKFGREVTSLLLPISFKELRAKTVITEVHPKHIDSLNALQAFGFQYEGSSLKHPMIIYKITKDEFNRNYGKP